jgi:coenzyme F420-dependent glucose-6-phosphate dehydrogenase
MSGAGKIGYHASHEQFRPSELLSCLKAAEGAGFTAAMCSDHFHPWSELQGQSGFAWSWIGAALEATALPIGVVNAPGQRYHPVLVAQAAATLAEMYPGRFWLAVGSGQNLNEHITGERWPSKAERNERLLEAVDVMRALWRGETVSHQGHFRVDEARLFTLAVKAPALFGAALTPATAAWIGSWADGLITIGRPLEELREVVAAFRESGGDGKTMLLQLQISYARSQEEAERAAFEEWRTTIFESEVLASLRMPSAFDSAARYVRPADLKGPLNVSADPQQHAAWLSEVLGLGFSVVYVHNVFRDQQWFIRDFGERVLPLVTGS